MWSCRSSVGGVTPTAKFQKDATFITRTATRSTTRSATFNALQSLSTPRNTPRSFQTILPLGEKPQKQSRKSSTMSSCHGRSGRRWRGFVLFAENLIRRISQTAQGIVQTLATTKIKARQSDEGHFCKQNALFAVPTSSRETDTTRQPKLVPVTVLSSCSTGKEKVYNLTVAHCPEYFANGILVHNCVAVGMACLALNMIPREHGLRHQMVYRPRPQRIINGIPRVDAGVNDQLYQMMNRTTGPVQSSAAERRGICGRGPKKWGNR